jgi:NAD+ kinase
MKVGIVAQRGNPRAVYLADDLRGTLDATVRIDEATAEALDAEGEPVGSLSDCHLVVSIGGDGTFLFAARGVGSVPILGVNLGEVGFLNAVAPTDAVEVVTSEVERFREDGSVQSRPLARLRAGGDGWSLPPALNEVVVQGTRRGHGCGVEYAVRVDGSLYSGGLADGVLVATPTGTTAYNLSEGGPLVHPSVDALVVTEMAASEPMPPLVAPLSATVTVRVEGPDGAVAISDGRTRRELSPPEQLTVERTEDPVRVAGPSVDFFEALGKLD